MAQEGVTFRVGFDDRDRVVAAKLYDEAFQQKLRPGIPHEAKRLRFLAAGMVPSHCIAAYDGERLVGIAGFHDVSGSLTGGIDFKLAREILGVWGALRAYAVFALLDRSPDEGELLMDGITVDAGERGRGVGTGLFKRLEAHCLENGFDRIRLDVVDTNPDARRLYERLGFEATKTEQVGWLKPFMGFSASTEMVKHLSG